MNEIVDRTPAVIYIACDLAESETLDGYRRRVHVPKRRWMRRH
jgi:hypothetical protein